MPTDRGAGVPESTSFAQALEDLKREGSNLLLVGDTDGGAHAAASRRLIGDDSAPRRRLFVFTEGEGVCADLPAEVDPATTTVVTQASEDGTATPEGWPDVEERVVDSSLLGPLATEVVAAVDEIDEAAGGLDPAQLRVCFDSVTSLARDHDSENVFRTLHLITSRVRQVNGMGHYHLRVDRDHDYVRLLEAVFDAVVEVRVDDGGVQQRWHLRDEEVTSDWIAL
jgi:hypothetical protein